MLVTWLFRIGLPLIAYWLTVAYWPNLLVILFDVSVGLFLLAELTGAAKQFKTPQQREDEAAEWLEAWAVEQKKPKADSEAEA